MLYLKNEFSHLSLTLPTKGNSLDEILKPELQNGVIQISKGNKIVIQEFLRMIFREKSKNLVQLYWETHPANTGIVLLPLRSVYTLPKDYKTETNPQKIKDMANEEIITTSKRFGYVLPHITIAFTFAKIFNERVANAKSANIFIFTHIPIYFQNQRYRIRVRFGLANEFMAYVELVPVENIIEISKFYSIFYVFVDPHAKITNAQRMNENSNISTF